MSIISKLTGGETSNLSNPKQWLVNLLGGSSTSSGVNVNEDNAITYSAVHNAITIYSEIAAMLPLNVYRRLDRGKEKARTHHLYKVLHDEPNPEMTSFLFRETLMGHLLTYRNAYAEIEYDKAGRVKALWPLLPDRTWPERDEKTQKLFYRTVLPNGKRVKLPEKLVFHIPGRSHNGIKGINLIQLMKDSIGTGLALEQYGARFFKNNGTPGGVLEHPENLSDKAHDHLKEDWEAKHSGLDNAHRVAILEEGMKWHQIGISPEDAQMLESKKFQVNEIARWLNIPPHMLKQMERATFSNIEQQSLEFVTYYLMPWLRRWEQQIKKDLISNNEFFAEFLVDALLRGDIESRYNAYSTGIQNGILTPNDAREKENMNPKSGGDQLFVPMNLLPLDTANKQDVEDSKSKGKVESRKEMRAKRSAAKRTNIRERYKKLIKNSMDNVVDKEIQGIEKISKKELRTESRNIQNFRDEIVEFYENFAGEVKEEMEPVLRNLSEAIAEEAASEVDLEDYTIDEFFNQYMKTMSESYAGYSRGQLLALMDEALQENKDPNKLVEERLKEWEEKRAEDEALKQSTKTEGAMYRHVTAIGGATKYVWVAGSSACPICSQLDGKVVGVEESFMEPTDTIDADDKNFSPGGTITHNPLHDGCDCSISVQ